MMNKISKVFAIISLLLITTIAYASPTDDLAKLLGSISTLQANFTQRVINQAGIATKTYTGSMAIAKPGKFRWDMQSPRQQLIVTNGKQIWVYDKALAQVTVQKVGKGLGGTPAAILSGSTQALFNAFYVTKSQNWFVLMPRFNSNFKEIHLQFDNNQLTKMQVIDSLGQASVISFTNIRVNVPVNNALFAFVIPKGVDVIGNQNQ